MKRNSNLIIPFFLDKEKVTLRILGIRNMSPNELSSTALPDELFDEQMRPSRAEKVNKFFFFKLFF